MSSTTSSSTPNTTSASTPQPCATNPNVLTALTPTPSNIDTFTDIITSAFHSTPLTTVFISEIDADPTTRALATPPFPHARRMAHFFPGIESAAHDGAELVEAGDWSALALWEAADFKGRPFVEAREGTIGEIFSEWRTTVRRMKAKFLRDPTAAEEEAGGSEQVKLRPFYHLSFLARNPNKESVPGAISAVLLPFLKRANEEGVPAWLEATSPHAMATYEHFGFRLCEKVTVGEGRCDERGYPCSGEGATGVNAWGMIYDVHLR